MAWATTVEQHGGAGPLRRMRVTVVGGPHVGDTLEVADEVLVGSSEACDLLLADPAASRRHLVLRPSAIGLRAIDQESRNGTWIGAQRVYDAELPPGTQIRVGDSTLRIEEALPATTPREDEPEPPPRRTSFGRFLGEAPCLGPLYERLDRLAGTSTTVLIEGESGTGKELLAEALHENGPRADKPFVIVDCAAIPESLVEARLFGHERGAFTGADRARPGVFEAASSGTVFLDEIGELSLEVQSRLLRVLDRGQVTRIGSTSPIEVDVRVIAATNRNLEREVEDGRFRLDLFYRLAVALLRVPPLRDRGGDVELLARALLNGYGGDPGLLASGTALERLHRHRWPGNVRELRNYVERLVVLGDAEIPETTTEGAVDDAARSGLAFRRARAIALSRFTHVYVEDMLARHGGNVSRAARAAGVARRYFQQLKLKT